MAGASHTFISPARVRYWSPDLDTNVRRVRGFQAECRCGWKGEVWKMRATAQMERSFHRCEPRV